ncbi:D-ala-D-ala transporter subunit; membrane component of ABC superfamily [Frankia canadensis]|uniref:D-ala-D-ala transporter subunit membrane component of ABC superfamily n=1 Tax=Frankia canadensis TaxID=1836972 RepID=A0A2I2KRQ7_9ACTN|nr:ABC transporter permease [Frankia canadensis]SNQ48340.1 D-ala-D-ala transporter subunit; membrane component of ABC superfamily [Frankia canadensis]SOU55630.1 D-ala-D-ala transporter subunit; membrane component of ABC superfamily [Frankia canadensis]
MTAPPEAATLRIRGGLAGRIGRAPLAVSWAVVGLILVALAWPGAFTSLAPDAADPAVALAPPGGGHPLGTDELGRDILSRIVYGARPSLLIGVGSTLIALVIGAALGVAAATWGRRADTVIMRLADVLLAFPGLLLALLVIATLGPGSTNSVIALACATMPGFLRIARSQSLVVRRSDFVRAAVVLGRPPLSIQLRHVLPNALPPLLVFSMINIGSAIIAGTTLSFLGLGPRAPQAEWGSMLSTSRNYLAVAWAPAVFPGVAIALTVVALNIAGRDLQRRFERRESVPRA